MEALVLVQTTKMKVRGRFHHRTCPSQCQAGMERTFFCEGPVARVSLVTRDHKVVNKVQVQPCFMMATLILWTDVEGLVVNCEGSVWTNFQLVRRVQGLNKTKRHSIHLALHNGVGPSAIGKFVSAKTSSMILVG